MLKAFITSVKRKGKPCKKILKIHHPSEGGGMNEMPATNTERAGRRSDPETSWRRSGTNEGRTKKELIAKRDRGGGRATVISPLHGPGREAYSDFEKADAFKDTLEVTFQENVKTYCDDKIEEVENVVCNYFDNFTTLSPPLTSPNGVRGFIKKLQNRKAAGPNQIPNIALKYFTLNALTHLTKIYNQCLIKNHFSTQGKQANVVMLPKPNQDLKFSHNYGPISLLSTTAKVFLRIILKRIKMHCKAIDCIPRNNAGSGRAIQRYTNL
ncbi:putative RNA-directed DNA polymerase from transposon X-element [Trichonephila clavipes]|nr:putative RNA-directed DNA polymerase from transposon X-element [Trichonephila clavipes]